MREKQPLFKAVPADGTVIKKTLGGKEMLVVEVNAKHFPYKKYKWGTWNFKISNLEFCKRQIREGSIVHGNLFDYIYYKDGVSPTRFHVLKVLLY